MVDRTPRDVATREKTARHVYVPPSHLPDPTPQPGKRFRWVATQLLGQSMATNVSTRRREGWEPVRAEDHPELMLPPNANGNIEIGGLMLCSAPEEMIESRNAYYNNQAERQMETVDNNLMRQSDPRMPIFNERKSSTSFGKGSK
jgi:hypothetical protein